MTLSSVSSFFSRIFKWTISSYVEASKKNFVSDYCNNKAANILKTDGMSTEWVEKIYGLQLVK
jgi:hypothetical protein